ncbi:hypothetical protein DU508_16495 [Pedobacter chinensis]|uniref:Uncharacterized protein n=1 Tax=Pedobacter chinensis TaxID=2282421 RepID=A0A369Q0J6_9SPHI|nr:hypothetical protein [Pedobacter chinensis]RDC55858.1 hypothetical protein DU508_16495 [Pedobacter chinensis]
MKQQARTIPGRLVDFDYSRYRLPTFVMRFKPLIYQDGDCYYAVLSFEEEHDVSGLGTSPEDALIDWNDKVCEMLALPGHLCAALKTKKK